MEAGENTREDTEVDDGSVEMVNVMHLEKQLSVVVPLSRARLLLSRCGKLLLRVFRHPVARLVPPVMIMYLDFFLFAQDPMLHSYAEASLGPVGLVVNLFNPVFRGGWVLLVQGCVGQGAPSWLIQTLSWCGVVFKITFGAGAAYVGIRLARAVHLGEHMLLGRVTTCCWVLSDKYAGRILPYLLVPLCLMAGACVWNIALRLLGVERPSEGLQYESYNTIYLTTGLGMTCRTLAKLFESFVFCIDFLTIIIVADVILQDHSHYPAWGKFRFAGRDVDLRRTWTYGFGGKLRVYGPWVCFAIAICKMISSIWFNDFADNFAVREIRGSWNWLLTLSEHGRAFVASVVLLLDVCVAIQDWEFPLYYNPFNVAFMGTNIVLEGRFVNYSMLVATMLNDFKSLVFNVYYDPPSYGEYVADDDFIWAIRNMTVFNSSSLDEISSISDFATREQFRNPNCTSSYCDVRLRAKYGDYFNSKNSDQWEKRWRAFCVMAPFLFALFLCCLLWYLILHSWRDLCRRVCQCASFDYSLQRKGFRLTNLAEAMERERHCTDTMHVPASVKAKRKFLRALTSASRVGDGNAIAGAEILCRASGNLDQRGVSDLVAMEPIQFGKTPAETDMDMVVVTSLGVFEVTPGSATVEHLKLELCRLKLVGTIPYHSLKLRKNPRRSLKDDVYLESLVAKGDGRRVTLIWVLGDLRDSVEKKLEEEAAARLRPSAAKHSLHDIAEEKSEEEASRSRLWSANSRYTVRDVVQERLRTSSSASGNLLGDVPRGSRGGRAIEMATRGDAPS